MIDRWMEEGIQAARAGNRQVAAQLFSNIVNADRTNLEAWLWLSDVLEDPEKRFEILTWLLQVDPTNRRARARLNFLNQQRTGSPPPARTAPQAAPQASQGFGEPAVRSVGHQHAENPKKAKLNEKTILISICILIVICLVGIGGVYLGTRITQAASSPPTEVSREEKELRPPLVEAAETAPALIPTEPEIAAVPPTATMTAEPVATETPLPSATPAPLPNFQDDFQSGISDMWFGDISAVKINNGRLGIKEPFSKIFIGEPTWNNYSLSFDVCVDGMYEDTVFAGMDILFHVKHSDKKEFTAYGFDFFGRFDQLRDYPDVLKSVEYTDAGGYDEYLDEIEVDFRFWESSCNQVNLVVKGKNGELFWNGNSIYTVGSVQPLDGAVGFDFYDYVTIDNVVVKPLP